MNALPLGPIPVEYSDADFASFLAAIAEAASPVSDEPSLFEVSFGEMGLEHQPPYRAPGNGIVSLPGDLREALRTQRQGATVAALDAFEAAVQHGLQVPAEAAWDSWEILDLLKKLASGELADRVRLIEEKMLRRASEMPTIQDGECYVCGEKSGAGGMANMLVCSGEESGVLCNRTACAQCVGWRKPGGGWDEAPDFFCNRCA